MNRHSDFRAIHSWLPAAPQKGLAGSRSAVRMAAATGLVLLALALRYAVLPSQDGFAFLTFYPAVVVCFLAFGTGPGILASLLSAALAGALYLPWTNAAGLKSTSCASRSGSTAQVTRSGSN